MIRKRNILAGLGCVIAAVAVMVAQAHAHQHTPWQNIHAVQPKPKFALPQAPRTTPPRRVWVPTLKRYM